MKRSVGGWAVVAVLALGGGGVAAEPVLPASEITETCLEILDLANTARIDARRLRGAAMSPEALEPYRDLVIPGQYGMLDGELIDVDQDGVPEPLGFAMSGGTCHSSWMIDLDAALVQGSAVYGYSGLSREELDGDALRFAGVGTSPILVRIRERPVIVTMFHRNIPTLAMLLHEGRQYPLCTFRRTGEERLGVVQRGAGRLCDDVAARRAPALEWPIGQPAMASPRDYFGVMADGGNALQADVDNDGREETVRRFTYASGAGCGSDHAWIVEVDAVGEPVASPLNDALLAPAVNARYRRREMTGDFLQRDGRVYYVGDDDAGAGLFTLGPGGRRAHCRFLRAPQVEIEHVFDPQR